MDRPEQRAQLDSRTKPPETAPDPAVGREQAASTSTVETLASASATGSIAERRGDARRRLWTWLRRGTRFGLWAGMVLAASAILLLGVFRFADPPFTAFTAVHTLSGGRVVQQWVPLQRISPNLVRAVVASEDAKFCTHFGVDLGEIEAAIERARGGIPRGASTISMQVIKNLFLWQSKSYVRKAIEIPLTLVMEQMWPKARILEVYLNIAEWGPGVYGAEAAAQFHFEKPASRLTEREAALLAVALPNPAMRDAGDPGPGTQRLADRIQARMKVVGRNITCVWHSESAQR